MEECPILSPSLEECLGVLATLLAQEKIPAAVDEIEAFVDGEDNRLLLSISIAKLEDEGELPETLRNSLPTLESLLLLQERGARMKLHGPGYLPIAWESTATASVTFLFFKFTGRRSKRSLRA